MRVPRRNAEDAGEPPQRSDRLPQRWVIILGLAGVAGLALGLKTDVTAGVTAGLGVVGLLHAIMD
jgi:hypothetical protein